MKTAHNIISSVRAFLYLTIPIAQGDQKQASQMRQEKKREVAQSGERPPIDPSPSLLLQALSLKHTPACGEDGLFKIR